MRTRRHGFHRLLAATALAASTAALSAPSVAHACGCFAPPDPTVPVLQAGERILFATSGNQVTAHIQIQYVGDAKEFGWLLPLPSVPTLELGTDELFAQLAQATRPSYFIEKYTTSGQCQAFDNTGGGSDLGAAFDGGLAGGPPSPAVVVDSIGPYDYAVLKADDRKVMLDWLNSNKYFIPTGTQDAVGPYVHPGAYFLALKLRSGQSAGDLQPVVLHYQSDLPMIPLVLTSVGAQPHMGIQVWMLGDSRAIPRNYYHVVLDEASIDWLRAGGNYNDVVVRAVAEAPGKHAFVTEYAGSSALMRKVLDRDGRFGDLDQLRKTTDAFEYTRFLRNNGYPYTSSLVAILARYIAEPQILVAQGIKPGQFYYNMDFYRQTRPDAFKGVTFSYDPAKLTDEIVSRIVKPTLDAGALFSASPYLTRLYTTLSPEDMTRDPVFSTNPFLPDVGLAHRAKAEQRCGNGQVIDVKVTTASGYQVVYSKYQRPAFVDRLPAAERVEILREAGSPEVVTDNHLLIEKELQRAAADTGSDGTPVQPALASNGCSVSPPASSTGRGAAALALSLGLALLGLAIARRARR